MRKRLQKLYIVHEKAWVRVLVEVFSTIVSPKFRRKIHHVSTLTQLGLLMPIEDLLIPTSAYLHDRRLSPDIFAPYATGKRAFSAKNPFPKDKDGNWRLPRVLRETTSFLLMDSNIRIEGIFRVAPNARVLSILKEAYDRGQKFIIWKEGTTTLPQRSQKRTGYPRVEEIDQKDGYGVHLAAGLIKAWYRDLREPVIPHTAYDELQSLFGDPNTGINAKLLVDLISLDSKWSCLPVNSRLILTRHLLPLLSLVANEQESNKMTPFNLAVCFAPTLTCGADPVQDNRIGPVVRKLLEVMIEEWGRGLKDVCEVRSEDFMHDLKGPEDPTLYEDPLERGRLNGSQKVAQVTNFGVSATQLEGIILEDNEAAESVAKLPPLPPRPGRPVTTEEIPERTLSGESPMRRKPAPPLKMPPRYSTITDFDVEIEDVPRYSTVMADDFNVTGSPAAYSATVDGHRPTRVPTDGIQEKDVKSLESENVEGAQPHAQPFSGTRKALTLKQITNISNSLQPLTQQAQTETIKSECSSNSVSHQETANETPSTHSVIGDISAPASAPKQRSLKPEKPIHNLREGLSGPHDSLSGRRPSFQGGEAIFIKPALPASATRSVSSPLPPQRSFTTHAGGASMILTLTKPIQPSSASAVSQSPSTFISPSSAGPTLVSPSIKGHTRSPSPGILDRTLAMQQQQMKQEGIKPLQRAKSDFGPGRKKLVLGKESVDDLKRLFEERAVAAKEIVAAKRGV